MYSNLYFEMTSFTIHRQVSLKITLKPAKCNTEAGILFIEQKNHISEHHSKFAKGALCVLVVKQIDLPKAIKVTIRYKADFLSNIPNIHLIRVPFHKDLRSLESAKYVP